MKKRLAMVFVAILSVAGQVCAQPKIPVFKKVVEVVSQNVNLRKEPNTSSPKLFWNSNSEKFVWEQTPDTKGVQPARADFLMIIDETQEWMHAYVLSNERVSDEAVYVSKKACRTKPIGNLMEVVKGYGNLDGWDIVNPIYLFGMDAPGIVGKVTGGVGIGYSLSYEDMNEGGIPYQIMERSTHQQMLTMLVPGTTTFSRQGETVEVDWHHAYQLNPSTFSGKWNR